MGTPEQELEFKYFIEGEAHAREGDRKEFRIHGTAVHEGRPSRLPLMSGP